MNEIENKTCNISDKKCVPCEGGIPALNDAAIQNLLSQLPFAWEIGKNKDEIFYDFKFKNYYHTMAFVNAIAWIAHTQNHHPDLTVGYNHCRVRYSTHAINGLSENDFICAAKVSLVFGEYKI